MGRNVRDKIDGAASPASPSGPKDQTDIVKVAVPALIEPAEFEAVQALLRSRNSKVMPPWVVTGPILLTGLATWASCGGGMTLRTGKSGRYRYYTCAACAQKGKTACEGRSIPMNELDTLVTSRLADQLLTPERMAKVLGD